MASKPEDKVDPLLHRPHADEEVSFGNEIELVADSNGGPPTVIRKKPPKLDWESLSLAARNMFADLAADPDSNRYQVLVESCLTNWADQLPPMSFNKLPDGNPTYLQDDVIPVIKAYVNRVPKPGIAGSPIPPALSMAELEALDFLHLHQALPYQQRDYINIFGRMPDGFIWHPVQTLVGTRGLDHRTLYEFRAYKHFWTIHQNDNSIREIATKGNPTWEVNIIKPDCDVDFPTLIPGGFHDMSCAPGAHQIRRQLTEANKERKKDGKTSWSPVIYVRFANNKAKLLMDHHNDPEVFDIEGVPRMREIGTVPYSEYHDTEDFLTSFTHCTRATVSLLPTIHDTRGEATETPSSEPNVTQAKCKLTKRDCMLAAEFITKFLDGSDSTIDAAAASMATDALQQLHDHVHKGKHDRCSHGATAVTVEKTRLKGHDLATRIEAVDATIAQLQFEQEHPRHLTPMSKLPGKGYSSDVTLPSKTSSEPIGGGTLGKDKYKSKHSKPAVTVGVKASILDIPVVPEYKLLPNVPGSWFATHVTRPTLVHSLLLTEDPDMIPTTGPGAKSWATLKEETRHHPLAQKSEIMEQSAKEHIKNLAVVSLQQTLYFYLITTGRLEKKQIAPDSPEATCLAKVADILEHGQRLVIEYFTLVGRTNSGHFIRPAGAAREWDHSMTSDKKAVPTGPSTINIQLTEKEQAAYWQLMDGTQALWMHPAHCGCWGWVLDKSST
ncbi:hypothetical protein ABW21_db0206839 [Orbilia brochopaga]|nr:hypothetical protein ABW21_db0206839 [Drechslerella brochopaga]